MPRFEYRGHESARQQQHTHNDYYNLWKKRAKKVYCSAISEQNQTRRSGKTKQNKEHQPDATLEKFRGFLNTRGCDLLLNLILL